MPFLQATPGLTYPQLRDARQRVFTLQLFCKSMNKKKICMVGEFAVGKTSLTQKFVNNVFSDKYLTTVGVKIDTVVVGDTKLIVWDVAGRDSLSPVNSSYLVGAAGIILVADGTRPETIEKLGQLWDTVSDRVGDIPVVVALNKNDSPDWQEPNNKSREEFEKRNWLTFETSAKEAVNVATIFERLVAQIISS